MNVIGWFLWNISNRQFDWLKVISEDFLMELICIRLMPIFTQPYFMFLYLFLCWRGVRMLFLCLFIYPNVTDTIIGVF